MLTHNQRLENLRARDPELVDAILDEVRHGVAVTDEMGVGWLRRLAKTLSRPAREAIEAQELEALTEAEIMSLGGAISLAVSVLQTAEDICESLAWPEVIGQIEVEHVDLAKLLDELREAMRARPHAGQTIWTYRSVDDPAGILTGVIGRVMDQDEDGAVVFSRHAFDRALAEYTGRMGRPILVGSHTIARIGGHDIEVPIVEDPTMPQGVARIFGADGESIDLDLGTTPENVQPGAQRRRTRRRDG